ncbi:type I-C CRISPR-associated protein Cas5c [Sphingomonas sp. Leaf343]|uniref:type I-C CRISPR-associated protein Cas5c n=1 Tax=Sphingomonas sp. Leaf343 TaxID=1736345 RepID=UPI0006F476AB|nr:type I-C CRISPR-associated protein Cas5c [Sphingomonas sp. Leaf343]KQR87940.1 type I-C CRISPR-associated protein Cas5 [Sphingomonas sp. Leaf343]
MTIGVRLHVWGELACFTRPEMKVERVSYDVMTPSAARGILEAIHWKPAIRWEVTHIHVLKPIRFRSIRRNEVSDKASAANAKKAMNAGTTAGLGIDITAARQQRAALVLEDVGYVIEARFHLTDAAGPDDSADKHIAMFTRRAASGQCFHRPCLGTREFAAAFRLLAPGDALPASTLADPDRNRDLGYMAFAPGYPGGPPASFFRAQLTDGVLDLTTLTDKGLMA